MSEAFTTAERLRRALGMAAEAVVRPEEAIGLLYPAACVRVPRLTVYLIRDYLERHAEWVPPGLVVCRDRRLRGGAIAGFGCGILFVDREDDEKEQKFTLAHELFHFLADHYYPRLELHSRFGDAILPVLDGERTATRSEEFAAVVGRTRLDLKAHLLDRDRPSAFLVGREQDADLFACELLAPWSGLIAEFPRLYTGDDSVRRVQEWINEEFRIPASAAREWAAYFVQRTGKRAMRPTIFGQAIRPVT